VDGGGGVMATRLDKVKSLSAEQIAKFIIDKDILSDAEPGQHFCKGDCDWGESMDIDDGPDEKECLRCCVRWLNEEVDR